MKPTRKAAKVKAVNDRKLENRRKRRVYDLAERLFGYAVYDEFDAVLRLLPLMEKAVTPLAPRRAGRGRR